MTAMLTAEEDEVLVAAAVEEVVVDVLVSERLQVARHAHALGSRIRGRARLPTVELGDVLEEVDLTTADVSIHSLPATDVQTHGARHTITIVRQHVNLRLGARVVEGGLADHA